MSGVKIYDLSAAIIMPALCVTGLKRRVEAFVEDCRISTTNTSTTKANGAVVECDGENAGLVELVEINHVCIGGRNFQIDYYFAELPGKAASPRGQTGDSYEVYRTPISINCI